RLLTQRAPTRRDIMKPEFTFDLGTMLPDELPYPWYRGREAAWLLYQRLKGPARIANLRKGPMAPLLSREPLRSVTAACGDGRLTPERLLPLADPWRTFDPDTAVNPDRATEAAFAALCQTDVIPYVVTFAEWAATAPRAEWREQQLSRPGGNLVVQVNFPHGFEREFARWLGENTRHQTAFYCHPVRRDGPITMSWARLDLDPWGEDVLIEELQTDWLRTVQRWRKRIAQAAGRKRAVAAARMLKAVLARHTPGWAEATLLAAVAVARVELGARRVWLHQPHGGQKLKNIRWSAPPRSLYSDLPRRFGFTPTHRAPDFLYRDRPQVVHRLRRSGRPVFWCMDFGATTESHDRRAA
ncbi:MAG: hypothetical protein AAF439_13530, partial [Pseudomonadota bacterium]